MCGCGKRNRITMGMRCVIPALVAALLSPMLNAQSGITTLSDLRDHARPLLIFAARPDDPQLTIQLRTLDDHAAEAHARQIVPVAIIYGNPSPTYAKFTVAGAEAIRRRFNVGPDDFTVILIGKDGGEKLRDRKRFSMSKLERTIDAMPMRQEELKGRKP